MNRSAAERTSSIRLEEITGGEMDNILLIADNNVRRRAVLRRFFSENGFLVMAVTNGLDCLSVLPDLRPDVLLIELDIPWGGGDGVLSQLNDVMPWGSKPAVFVMGDAPARTLSSRSGVTVQNCFQEPVGKEPLLDRIGMELAAKVLRITSDRQRLRTEKNARTLPVAEAV